MKKIILLPLLLLFAACQEEGPLTRDKETILVTPAAVLKYYGVFEPTSGISVMGEAKIYQEDTQYKVQLDHFAISEGPDLKVYLSKAATPTDYVTLGNLTSQSVYAIPQSVNISEYSHVLIHCQQYNHLFAVAELIQN